MIDELTAFAASQQMEPWGEAQIAQLHAAGASLRERAKSGRGFYDYSK